MKSTSILALLAAVAFVKIGATTSSLPYEVDAGASEGTKLLYTRSLDTDIDLLSGDKEHQGNRLVPRQVSPPPAPTASGTSTSCDLWYTVTAADPLACKNAMTYGTLSLEKFLALNPAVNSNCTNLWIGYAYCIGGKSAAYINPESVMQKWSWFADWRMGCTRDL